MVHFFPMRLLSLQNATQQNAGEHSMMIANSCHKTFFADSPSADPLSWSSSTNRWCQNHYNLIPVFTVSTRYKQLSISSISDKKTLLEFTMSMYFHLQVTTCLISFFSTEMFRFYTFFNIICNLYLPHVNFITIVLHRIKSEQHRERKWLRAPSIYSALN